MPPLDAMVREAEMLDRFTSTGSKWWSESNRGAMENYRRGDPRTVISTHISPEGACNLKCPYCSVTYRDTHQRIALPIVKQYVLDLRSRGLKAVILTGGLDHRVDIQRDAVAVRRSTASAPVMGSCC